MNLRRNGLHAAPLHESLPVAWRRLVMNARAITRRPGARPADAGPEGSAAPPAGRGAVSVPPVMEAAPLIDTVLLAVETPVLYRDGELPLLTKHTEGWWLS